MKKRLLLVIALAGTSVIFAQRLTTARVPLIVKESFQKAHPGTATIWEREDANYEANFKEGGKSMSCVIDGGGTILETESSISYNELPAVAKIYVEQHYKGKKIREVARIEKADGDTNYEVNVQGKDILFNRNGKHIEKPKEKRKKEEAATRLSFKSQAG